MNNITLYKYNRPDGGINISPIKPDTEHTTLHRLIADEGKILTDGETLTSVIDTYTPEVWTEIDAPEPEETEDQTEEWEE